MKKILIVEDTQDFSDILKYILSHEGYQVETAFSGEECLIKVRANKPDLILMDVMMPGMDGAETTVKIKEYDDLAYIPIVFLTALATEKRVGDNEIIVQGRRFPAMSKLMDRNEMLKRIRQFING